ncbi:MAG: hypothetical protein IJI84_04045 [Clostridia bacterium]|nr:hypothetical protein [Clostridia bacterium]
MVEQISVLGGTHHPQMAAAANDFIKDIAKGKVDISGDNSQAFKSGNSYGRGGNNWNFRVVVEEISPTRYGVPIKLRIYVEVQFSGWKPVAGTKQVYINNDVDNILNGPGQDRNNWINDYQNYRVALFDRLK